MKRFHVYLRSADICDKTFMIPSLILSPFDRRYVSVISTSGGIEWVKVPREETMAAKELSQERDDYGLVMV